MSHRRPFALSAILLSLCLVSRPSVAQDPNAPPPPPGPAGAPEAAQVLTRGPVHEAFAGPVVYDPKPGPVISQPPPQPIQELPPDQKPEGANIAWIPGYWAWDDTRNDYLWISGVWRNIPPGRQWVPGYWHQVAGGVQWAPGTWMAEQSNQAQYLAAPPASLENGPNSPSPVAGAIWAPGNWVWQDNQYFWRPGFWVNPQPNWVWVPAQYVWTPSGYIFTEGYWDRPIATRGQMFAPVYYTQPVYLQPAYVYQPTIGIVSDGLMVSLFVRPSCRAYYFGDYYASNYVGIGIYPWYSYHQSRFGYDPLYSYYSVTYAQTNPRWAVSIREEYVYRQNNIAARPPHTYREMEVITRNNVTVNNITINKTVNNVRVNNIHQTSFAAPINKIAANGGANGGMRFQRIEAAEQRQQMQQARQVQQFQQQRARSEAVAMRDARKGEAFKPHAMDLPKSPVAAPPRQRAAQAEHLMNANQPRPGAGPNARENGKPRAAEAAAPHEPPAHPAHPKVEANAARLREGNPNPRPEPRFDAPTQPGGGQARPGGQPQPRPGAQPHPGAQQPKSAARNEAKRAERK